MSRTIVIGDIHGCYGELVSLLQKAELADTDKVIAVGDLIVKGGKNKEVLDLFINDARFAVSLEITITPAWLSQLEAFVVVAYRTKLVELLSL